jgi:hypothetical protein
VESVRSHAPCLLLRFQEVTSLEQAQELRHALVSVEERWLPQFARGNFIIIK